MKKTLLTVSLLLLFVFALVSCGTNPCTEHVDKDGNLVCDVCQAELSPDEDDNPPVSYTVRWFDENGTLLSSENVNEGSTPSYTYTLTDTAEWDYTVLGWSLSVNGELLSEIPVASADASYYAVVSATKQKYTVSFNTQGGSVVESQTVEYGAKASAPETPKYDGHKFVCWSTANDAATPVDFEKAITGNVEYFAIWNEVINVKTLLATLINGYKLNPYEYIPESMRHDFSANLVDKNGIPTSYSSFVNVSDIYYGFGEQWNMVFDNIRESETFFELLSVVETVSTATVTIFNNYFDENPSDTARHEFKYGIYDVAINFDGEYIDYVLEFTTAGQSAQIALNMNVETLEKNVRIQLGDANALSYKITENSYEFAIKYLGVRSAMISIEKDGNGNTNGKIYEYLTVSSVSIASAAEFYITDEYVSVIGNKADGMLGFTGYIAELYDVESGKMIAYEVKETLSAINYDTLWFNLSDIDGINSIKYVEKTNNSAAKIYVNGSSSEWEVKKNLLSRRFDIEWRTQYVYSYDTDTETYTRHQISVPMLFIQEDNYSTFVADVKSVNNITVSVDVSANDLNKLLSDYDVYIPVFIENKDNMSAELIIEYIGEKKTFN